ncbi:MAG: IS91 family transposase, partial [Methyloprofundus sp.]|nr:IS91 family transposase [Methyloprofundus sp.]
MSTLERPQLEVADIIHEYGDDYRQAHRLSPMQHGVLNAISHCRTDILGGHIDQCNACGHQHIAYNSCRNRHCPKCQGMDNIRWVKERENELLPIQYFHVIFTLPHELNLLAQYNPALLYTILIQSATETLQSFADKRWKGTLGITVVLHTWGQKLEQHIHLHTIVTGGVLTHDKQRWINAPKNYLFKVENLSTVYREKFCDKLKQAFERG